MQQRMHMHGHAAASWRTMCNLDIKRYTALRSYYYGGGGCHNLQGRQKLTQGIPVLRYNVDASTFTVVTSPRIILFRAGDAAAFAPHYYFLRS